jgi:thiol-disulfide isomerase/thioredoxin
MMGRESLAKLVAWAWRKSSLLVGEIHRCGPANSIAAVLCFTLCLAPGAQSANHAPGSRSLVGRTAPAIAVTTLDGKPVSLADYRGKAVLVNFWATWCGNCKLEMPWLAALREKYAARGFEVLGIITDDAPVRKISALTQKYGVKYPILICNHTTAQAYGGLPDLPESFFIDRQGRIVAFMDGADSKAQIETNIIRALRTK